MPANCPELPVSKAGWRLPTMIWLHLGAVLLLASWLWPASRALWNQLDIQGFHLLNGSLELHPLWAGFWALSSLRVFDLLAACVMLLMFLRKDWLFSQGERWHALFTFLGLLVTLLVFRVLFSRMVDAFDWQHSSPSLMIEGSLRLSEQFPWLAEHLDLKDASKRSFPGDHASVLMLWGVFLALSARGGKLALVVFITLFLMLPRLVAGAHWISDDLVGGVILTLLAFAWGYCTPFAELLASGLLRLANPVLKRLPRWV